MLSVIKVGQDGYGYVELTEEQGQAIASKGVIRLFNDLQGALYVQATGVAKDYITKEETLEVKQVKSTDMKEYEVTEEEANTVIGKVFYNAPKLSKNQKVMLGTELHTIIEILKGENKKAPKTLVTKKVDTVEMATKYRVKSKDSTEVVYVEAYSEALSKTIDWGYMG